MPKVHSTEVLSKKRDSNNIESGIEVHTIHTSNGCDICVPGSVNDLVSYVLMEQETWFEPELEFLTKASSFIKRAIDISALYGVYSLPLSSQVEKVFVFESSPVTTWYLKKSIELNHIDNISIISRTFANNTSGESGVDDFNMDESSKLFSLDNIDLVIINLGGHEKNILSHAQNFLANNQPLIMHRRNKNDALNQKLIDSFKEAEYKCYYLVPGLLVLAPLEDINLLEASSTNLFFCKDLTANKLSEAGLLCQSLHSVEYDKDADSNISQQLSSALESYPYAKQLKQNWSLEQIAAHELPDKYQQSLLYYFKAHDSNFKAEQRVSYLMESFNTLSDSLKDTASLSQLMSLARISDELGLTSTTLQALSLILETFCSENIMNVDEPFLASHRSFDQVDPGEQLGEWIFSSVLQTYLWKKSVSSYFMDAKELATFQGLTIDPFVQIRTERARQLLNIKLGQKNSVEPHNLLKLHSVDNLNHDFWNKV